MSAQTQAFQAVEKVRNQWSMMRIPCLAAEVAGLVLMFTGRQNAGVGVALIGLISSLVLSRIGKKQYQQACAEASVRESLGMADARFLSKEEAAEFRPVMDLLLPPELAVSKPLFMYPAKGTVSGTPLALAEATIGYKSPRDGKNLFLSGTLGILPAEGMGSGVKALIGKPYGETLRISDFPGFSFQETSGRPLQVMLHEHSPLTDAQLDAIAGFAKAHDTDAVLITDRGRFVFFLFHCFYSGNWTLFNRMPESALSKSPLPEIPGLIRLSGILAGNEPQAEGEIEKQEG